MPIAEILGAELDMQVLFKLSVSVLTVALVSWAYCFYSSRNVREIQQSGKQDQRPPHATCRNCKTTLLHQNSEDLLEQPGSVFMNSAPDGWMSGKTKEVLTETPLHEDKNSKELFCKSKCDQIEGVEMESEQKHSLSASRIASFHSSSTLQEPTRDNISSITRPRSPCILKLQARTGVGRELRQDMEHQGVCSSFLSKAEIKVEDANIALNGSGDRFVHGKIYDYYVESSSLSVTDARVAFGQDRHSDAKYYGFGNHSRRLTESYSSVNSVVMNDLAPQLRSVEDASSQSSHKLRHPARPALLRRESYQSATQESELFFAFQNSPAPESLSLASLNSGTASVQTLTDKERQEAAEKVDPNNSAGCPLICRSEFSKSNFENLPRTLDLGNCLEAFYLAKKNGKKSLQQAALKVMSDNYLQVLRDSRLYGRLMAGEREQIRKQRLSGRRFVMVADMDPNDWLFDTAGRKETPKQRRTSSAMYYYDDYKDSWHILSLTPPEVISKACAMCTMANYLFVAVGCEGRDRQTTPSKRVFCFNPLINTWREISPMNEARPRCKLASLEGYVYAIGGECLSSVERYDPRLDKWTFVAPLPNDTFAVAHHVTVCDGELFVSGGTFRSVLLRYNPKTDTWRPSLIVGSQDRTTDLVGVGRCIYRFDLNPLSGISVYRYHTVARLWYECSSKRLSHCPAFQCVAVDEAIYCISRQFTMRFDADDVSPAFADEDLSVLSVAKGMLFPFVLSLPDKKLQQTRV